MFKTKYYYDPNTLSYRKIEINSKSQLKKIFSFLFASFIFGSMTMQTIGQRSGPKPSNTIGGRLKFDLIYFANMSKFAFPGIFLPFQNRVSTALIMRCGVIWYGQATCRNPRNAGDTQFMNAWSAPLCP